MRAKGKRTVLMIALAISVLFCGCTGNRRNSEGKDIADSEVVYQIESAEDLSTDESETVTGKTSFTNETSEAENVVADELETIIDLVGRDDFVIGTNESWGVEIIDNLIPIVPDEYEGILVNYTMPYTDKNGKEIQRTYENVAFVDVNSEYIDYDKYYMTSDIVEVDGEQMSGFFICENENMYFLEHKKGEEVVERFYLNIKLPEMYYMHVAAHNEKAALIWAGSYLFTYEFESEKCSIITDSSLSFDSPVEDELYFTDWSHTEYVSNWAENNEAVKTGRKVVTYFYNCDIKAIEDEVVQANFSAIQEAAKNGKLDKDYIGDKGYDIYNDCLYDWHIEKGFLGNIHLPYASNESGYCVFDEFRSCWEVDKNKLTLYRFGDIVRKYDIEEGSWAIIDSSLAVTEKLAHADDDAIISAETFDKQIVVADVLLLNTTDNCLYHLSDIEGRVDITVVAEDVQDCFASYENAGIVYWLDGKDNAYELFWVVDDDSIIIGENAVGIAKNHGETAGFIVKPEDSRCNAITEGYHLCTQYGKDWLNQDQTSAAWALEYDWD